VISSSRHEPGLRADTLHPLPPPRMDHAGPPRGRPTFNRPRRPHSGPSTPLNGPGCGARRASLRRASWARRGASRAVWPGECCVARMTGGDVGRSGSGGSSPWSSRRVREMRNGGPWEGPVARDIGGAAEEAGKQRAGAARRWRGDVGPPTASSPSSTGRHQRRRLEERGGAWGELTALVSLPRSGHDSGVRAGAASRTTHSGSTTTRLRPPHGSFVRYAE